MPRDGIIGSHRSSPPFLPHHPPLRPPPEEKKNKRYFYISKVILDNDRQKAYTQVAGRTANGRPVRLRLEWYVSKWTPASSRVSSEMRCTPILLGGVHLPFGDTCSGRIRPCETDRDPVDGRFGFRVFRLLPAPVAFCTDRSVSDPTTRAPDAHACEVFELQFRRNPYHQERRDESY